LGSEEAITGRRKPISMVNGYVISPLRLGIENTEINKGEEKR
jgi:hypothetical protein